MGNLETHVRVEPYRKAFGRESTQKTLGIFPHAAEIMAEESAKRKRKLSGESSVQQVKS